MSNTLIPTMRLRWRQATGYDCDSPRAREYGWEGLHRDYLLEQCFLDGNREVWREIQVERP